MLIGFNNIHFSWKEMILLIERGERERGERERERGKKKRGASFHFQVRPWDNALEKALYRFRANEIKWCRPWQKGKPKLKAIYFHWGMWHCSGTINGLSTDTEMCREKKGRRYKALTGGTDESRIWTDKPKWLILLYFFCLFSVLLTLN